MATEPVYVQAGERLVIDIRSGDETLAWDTLVADACDNDSGGYWYCDNCRKSLAHNMDTGSHTRKEHRLAWICMEHGPETVRPK